MVWPNSRKDRGDKDKDPAQATQRQKLLDALSEHAGAFWTSPSGKVWRVCKDGAYIEETNSAVPWGEVPIETLARIYNSMVKPIPVTEEFVLDHIKARKERGEDTRMEEAIYRWYFRYGPMPQALIPKAMPKSWSEAGRPQETTPKAGIDSQDHRGNGKPIRGTVEELDPGPEDLEQPDLGPDELPF